MGLVSKTTKEIKLFNIPIIITAQIDKKFQELGYCHSKDYLFESNLLNTGLHIYEGPTDIKFDVLHLIIYNNKMLKDSKVKESLFEYML